MSLHGFPFFHFLAMIRAMSLENWTPVDSGFLRRSLELAALGRGLADPNPFVGAVLVNDGRIVGEGWHRRAGEPHAEVLALEAAGQQALGSTLYINLEPCCHYGRTPPCVPRLLEAGVNRVVVGLIDPDRRVCGQGVASLRDQGVTVVLAPPEVQQECAFLNQFFLASQRHGRPFVTLKFAMTLDGKIATRTGQSQWITGEEARARVHQERALHQAILVGRGTVMADDPRLNVRGVSGSRQPLRVILDSLGRIAHGARLLSSPGGPVMFATTSRSSANWREGLRQRGAEVLEVEEDDEGRVSLRSLLHHLHRNGIRSVFAEGGGQLHGSLVDQALATRVLGFIAPRIIGGEAAPTPIAGLGAASMDQAQSLRHARGCAVGGDFLVEGYLDDSWLTPPA